MLLEKEKDSMSPVAVAEPQFKVLPEFVDSSYAKRYELLCRKMALERLYDEAAFLLTDRIGGLEGEYEEPADDLTFMKFGKALLGKAIAFRKG